MRSFLFWFGKSCILCLKVPTNTIYSVIEKTVDNYRFSDEKQ